MSGLTAERLAEVLPNFVPGWAGLVERGDMRGLGHQVLEFVLQHAWDPEPGPVWFQDRQAHLVGPGRESGTYVIQLGDGDLRVVHRSVLTLLPPVEKTVTSGTWDDRDMAVWVPKATDPWQRLPVDLSAASRMIVELEDYDPEDRSWLVVVHGWMDRGKGWTAWTPVGDRPKAWAAESNLQQPTRPALRAIERWKS